MTAINYAMYTLNQLYFNLLHDKAKNRQKNDSGTKEQKQNYPKIWKA